MLRKFKANAIYPSLKKSNEENMVCVETADDCEVKPGYTFEAIVQNVVRHAKENRGSVENITAKNVEKLEKIGKHCKRDGCGTVYFKQSRVDDISTALQIGIAHDTFAAKTEERIEGVIIEQDFKCIKKTRFPKSGSKTTPGHNVNDFKFVSYAPQGFKYFRKVFNVTDQEYADEILTKPLRAVVNPGGSGALMWFSQNHEFVIKTVAREQANFLHSMLRGYYLNMDQNPNTLLTKFYGLYILKQNGKRIRVVVMKNFFPKDVQFDYKFDLKGSTINRFASEKEKARKAPTLKDIDFNTIFPKGITIEEKYYTALKQALARDTLVLHSFNIFDYSLILAVKTPQNQAVIAKLKEMSVGSSPLDSVVNSYGIPGTTENGEYVYLWWGLVDILQEYDLAHKIQYRWKAVKHGISQLSFVSVQPPRQYRERFQNYLFDRVFKKTQNQDQAQTETKAAVKERWKRAYALLQPS